MGVAYYLLVPCNAVDTVNKQICIFFSSREIMNETHHIIIIIFLPFSIKRLLLTINCF